MQQTVRTGPSSSNMTLIGRAIWLYALPPCFLIIFMILTPVYGSSSVGRPKVNYTVSENQPSRTLIGNVGYNAGLYEMYSEPIRRDMRYQWLGDDPLQNLFSITTDRGELYTEQVLDREELCEQQPLCQLVLRVAVQPVPDIFMMIIQVRALCVSACICHGVGVLRVSFEMLFKFLTDE